MDTSGSTPKCATDDSENSGIPVGAHANELKGRVNPKERLSAYFTIAAAAFGLISDGCEY